MHNEDLISLRLVELRDAALIFDWETDKEIRRFTERDAPITIELIEAVIREQRSVFDSGQVRFIVCNKHSNIPVGLVDLYNIDFTTETAEVGIAIIDELNRQKGFASAALDEIKEYAANVLGLYCLRSFVEFDNIASNILFERLGYDIEESNVIMSGKTMNIYKIEF
ncbi:MAG: GNAT family N-acetyltransferase [Crocinitomicaceae bacterium]|nr:GNAT family N-acetyltransferase [Crocinitomicaceae bacterium]